MDRDKKHIEIKDNIVADENLIDFFEDEFKDAKFNNPEKDMFEDFMKKELGYSVTFKKITNKERKSVTVQEFLDDLQKRVKEDSGFSMKIKVCEHLEKYIDFEKTNVNVSLPINIDHDSQKFLKKLHNCNKTVYIHQWILNDARSVEWLREEENIEIVEKLRDRLDLNVPEFIEKFNMFKKYVSEKGISYYDTGKEYEFFIINSYELTNLIVLDRLKNMEMWMEDNGFKTERVNLKIDPQNKEITDENIKKLLESGKYTAQIDSYEINLEDIERIKILEKLGVNPKIERDTACLKTDTIAQVDNEILEKLDIKYVEIGSNENRYEEKLELSKYKIIRKVLEDVVKDIDMEQSDKEKFKMVYTRLANMITYDEEAAKDESEYAKENSSKCRNLENGLLAGKCVCAGYAEILKQALSLVGIESHYISSKIDEKENSSHAYNMVKIDGQWYNADLTWDYECIRNNVRPKYCLKNDKDFRKVGTNSKEYHTPSDETLPYKSESKSIELYPELSNNRMKLYINMAREVGIKKILSNLGEIIKEKFSKNETLMLETTVNQKEKDGKIFRESFRDGVPNPNEQKKFIESRQESTENLEKETVQKDNSDEITK